MAIRQLDWKGAPKEGKNIVRRRKYSLQICSVQQKEKFQTRVHTSGKWDFIELHIGIKQRCYM